MADSDLTIVILRNIQSELVSLNERMDGFSVRLDSHGERIDSVAHQLVNVDNRLANVEDIVVKTATSLGIDAQSSRRRSMRNEGEIAELKVRVSALETIVKGKPTL